MLRKRNKYPKIYPRDEMTTIYEDGICLEERKEGAEAYSVAGATPAEDTHSAVASFVGDYAHPPPTTTTKKLVNYTVMVDIVIPFVRRILPNGL